MNTDSCDMARVETEQDVFYGPVGAFTWKTHTIEGKGEYRYAVIKLPIPDGEDGHPQGITTIPVNAHGIVSTSWNWDGNEDRPTITPSIFFNRDREPSWHGFVTAGRLVSC